MRCTPHDPHPDPYLNLLYDPYPFLHHLAILIRWLVLKLLIMVRWYADVLLVWWKWTATIATDVAWTYWPFSHGCNITRWIRPTKHVMTSFCNVLKTCWKNHIRSKCVLPLVCQHSMHATGGICAERPNEIAKYVLHTLHFPCLERGWFWCPYCPFRLKVQSQCQKRREDARGTYSIML